jgi:hypothetical protein
VALGQALVPVTKPKLSGPHQPGQEKMVTAGRWSPKASTVTYQWYLGSAKVKGATKSFFTVPRSARKGHQGPLRGDGVGGWILPRQLHRPVREDHLTGVASARRAARC